MISVNLCGWIFSFYVDTITSDEVIDGLLGSFEIQLLSIQNSLSRFDFVDLTLCGNILTTSSTDEFSKDSKQFCWFVNLSTWEKLTPDNRAVEIFYQNVYLHAIQDAPAETSFVSLLQKLKSLQPLEISCEHYSRLLRS